MLPIEAELEVVAWLEELDAAWLEVLLHQTRSAKFDKISMGTAYDDLVELVEMGLLGNIVSSFSTTFYRTNFSTHDMVLNVLLDVLLGRDMVELMLELLEERVL